MVYIIYCDSSLQFQMNTQLVYGEISITNFSGNEEMQTSARNKSPSQLGLLHCNDLQWKLNGGKGFDNKIDVG